MRDEWVQRARDADIADVAVRLGARLKKAGRDFHGPCPACGGTDRFIITPAQTEPGKRWMCRGAEGGDVIAMTMHVMGCDFLGAVEWITGQPAPSGKGGTYIDQDVQRERRAEREDRRRASIQQEKQEGKRKMQSAQELWDSAVPLIGSPGEAYFRARGIHVRADLFQDIRFAPSLEYMGYKSPETDELDSLGSFPCVIAAMRNIDGAITAAHRTYLSPRANAKLTPPGDQTRNKAKKVMGRPQGSMIRLGLLGPDIAIGEGIETTLSWFQMYDGPTDYSLAAAYSLDNISGGSTGTVPHPTIPGRTIRNGIPDMDRPGAILPDMIEHVTIIGDGDSDGPMTRAALLTAARRWRARGKQVDLSMAAPGKDFNDMLLDMVEVAA